MSVYSEARILEFSLDNFKFKFEKDTLKITLYYGDQIIDSYFSNKNLTEKTKFTLEEVLKFIKPVLDISPICVSKTFTDKDDPYHWQQPCCTEMKAYELHSSIPLGTNFNKDNKTIDTYVGIPWASFIDKKCNLGEVTSILKPKIESYKKIARNAGYTLNIHTVCQSIHWKRFLDYFYQIGITDIHASHYENVLSKLENPYNLKIHSWHLYAVNVEDPDRNDNIIINKSLEEKHLLASFKGAHMPHYISNIRTLLGLALAKDKIKEDISIEVTDEWHFNKQVFSHQVKGLDITNIVSDKDVRIYNDLLCGSIFSLCPEGAGVNTIRLWESLAVGSIPVFMISNMNIPMLYRLHPDLHKCCILVFKDKVTDVFKLLRSISKEKILEKQHLCREVYLEIKNQTTFKNQYNTLFGLY